ncbi:MAG TPA: guanylate kinase [Candidatus Dormibacteraeota bacterium]|nr:guanylate kinase [Candidatus Dormibacteraeota bacterium]
MAGPGLLFVVSGPSGAGKDTLMEALMAGSTSLRYSVSATTRPPREGEREGESYFFLPREAFETGIREGQFLETREYNGNLYGTPRGFIEKTLAEGYDVVAKPEVNGALRIKTSFPDAVLIFVLPDKFAHLRRRLEERRTETNEQITARLAIAHEEIKSIRSFDYVVINAQNQHEAAVRDLRAILRAEKLRIHRYHDGRIQEIVTES